MKVIIISDIHDNLVNLEKCLNWCKKEDVESLICCGDIANGVTLKYLAENFKDVYLVRGNLEIYDEMEASQYKNIKYLGRFGCFELGGKKVGVCHEKLYNNLQKECSCDIIFYGHSHKPWIENKNGVDIINPGTLGGVFTKATFAVWELETGKLELKVLELV